MFPGIYDFRWDAGHIIFLGIFYGVLAIVAATLTIATLRAIRDYRNRRTEALRWHVDFDDLPEAFRRCRHELSGETERRTCPNAFDCRECSEHPRFMALRARKPLPELQRQVGGFDVPSDRLYHRGHTWVRQEPDGLLTIGVDDLGAHLIGKPDKLRMPAQGERLAANGTAWHVEKDGVGLRVLAPIDGEVVDVGGPDAGWYLKLRPDAGGADTRHLLSAAEARPWMMRELERLQAALSHEGVGTTLADGGVPVEDLGSVIPQERKDEVLGMMFLDV